MFLLKLLVKRELPRGISKIDLLSGVNIMKSNVFLMRNNVRGYLPPIGVVVVGDLN